MRAKPALIAAAAFTVLVVAPDACAQSAGADPAFQPGIYGLASSPATLQSFSLAGANLALMARGRRAAIDTSARAHSLEEAVEMSKVMPGFPQPAFVTFDLKMSF